MTGPSDRTAARTAAFTFQSDQRRVRYVFRLDGRRWSTPSRTASASLGRLRPGRHVLAVRALSASGRLGPATRARFVVDRTRPQTRFLGAPRSGAVRLRRATALRFTAGERDATYECRIDQERFAACTSPLVLGGLARGRHTLAVRAVDAARNVDASPVTRALVAGPATLFGDDFESGGLSRWAVTTGGGGTAAAQSAVVDDGVFAARLAASATPGSVAYARAVLSASISDIGVAADVRVDGEGPSGGSVPLLRLFDAAGTRTVNVYRQNATGRIWVQHSGLYASTNATLPLGAWARVELRAAAGSGSGLVQLRVGGSLAYSTSAASLGGAKTVQIGNEAKAQAGVVVVDDLAVTNSGADATPPQTTITSAPSGTVAGGGATIAFSASEPGSAFQCSLDGAVFAACGSPQSYTGLAAGPHTFAVRAIDVAGNVDATPATASWTASGAPKPALLIADNQNRRILITDYDGKVLWKFDNPTGETSAYSGPLGVRWMANGHILATFGTGKVGEIDPATKTFVWKTAGYGGDWFQSPYDAALLPDGNLAVATANNEGGRVAVYNRATGATVWKFLINYPRLVEMIPAGLGTSTSKPTLLMAGFSKLTEAVYDPGGSSDKSVVWRWEAGSNTHRAILDRDGRSIVLSDQDNLIKVARPSQAVTWSRFQGNCCNGEVRGVAMTDTGGYVMGYRVWNGASQVRFTDGGGQLLRSWSSLNDGTRLNLVWGLRTLSYPG